MKYLKEVTIIFGITMLGEFLNYLLPFPVPSGVYGLFILLLLLCTGALHTEDVAEVGDFFLDTMPIMFIPAGVGPVSYTHLDVYKRQSRWLSIQMRDFREAREERPYMILIRQNLSRK